MQDYFNDQQQEEPIPMLESSEWRENWHVNMVRLVEWSCNLQLLANFIKFQSMFIQIAN